MHAQHNNMVPYVQSPGGIRPHAGYPPPTAPKPVRYPGDAHTAVRPEDVGYRDSPPPPPPPTSTHPLYQSGSSSAGQKVMSPTVNSDNRFVMLT